MPWELKRFQNTGHLHYITFTGYHRSPMLATPEARDTFERVLERVRRWYGFCVSGYVVMPEHVHLLVSEPERAKLATAMQMLKQIVSRKLSHGGGPPFRPPLAKGGAVERAAPFWQKRYYDFDVWSESKRIEKLRYIHRNPVKRGLVERPEDWVWSSFRHYATGVEGVVEIESEWTARKRERMGLALKVKHAEE
jgi:REP-associated tyrosine transposase